MTPISPRQRMTLINSANHTKSAVIKTFRPPRWSIFSSKGRLLKRLETIPLSFKEVNTP